MRSQLEHLLAVSERDNIEVLVLPTAIGAHDGLVGPFTLLDFAAAQSIVYVEIVNGAVTVTVSPEAWTVRSLDTGHTLVFDETEWTAFRLGATDGEFDPSLSRELASTWVS